MKISLFYKPSIIKVCSFFILLSIVTFSPKTANASFFTDFANLTTKVLGLKASAADAVEPQGGITQNSQTIPLLESSVNPDTKNIKDTPSIIVDNEALSSENIQAVETDTNSYVSSSEKIITYKVKEGETLGKIAAKFNISKNTIIYANTTIKNNVLKVGQTLVILPVDGVSYTIKKGDTLASISKAFKADTNDIAEYNDISINKGLQAGETIIVPGGTAIVKKAEPTIAKAENKVEKEQPQPKTQIQESSNDTEAQTPTPTQAPNTATGKGILGGYIWPFPSGTGRVSQKLHDDNAYDFAAPKGTPIYAIQDGNVLIADGNGYNGGYGLYVVIDFNDGAQAIFGHMSKVTAIAGESVKKGDIIGYVGSTGKSTGNHVHIGYRGGMSNPYKNLPLNSDGL
ncbi:MAG: M23 family metallopeptidase [Candidatus Nomurabacteria bacterium]|nr:M23 family metallopeptidase [Candidatus Nomurabacteria bacterium]